MAYTDFDALAGEWRRWTWPVFQMTLERPAPRELLHVMPPIPLATHPDGMFVVAGFNAPEPIQPARVYDPLEDAPRVFAAATAIDPADDAALLLFVNTWGLLGVSLEPRDPRDMGQYWESVFLVRKALAELRRLSAWLQAMKDGRWSDPALPTIDVPLAKRIEAYRQRFAVDLNQRLRRSPIRLELELDTFNPLFRPKTLADVLFIHLWQHARDDDTVARRCEACGGLFFVSSTNRKRRHCSFTCKNRMTRRRRYRREQAERRLQRIATKDRIGGQKAPQVQVATKKNARQSTGRKRRA